MDPGTSLNFVWTLLAGFLVMFMQAGFALLETGLCRAKNAAHTMSMNMLVYALGVVGFFVCGFAFLAGGVGGDIGGLGTLGGAPALDHMFHLGRWGILGHQGFFLAGLSSQPAAMAFFFYMAVFMDTAATIPTGALAERWSFKSFCLFSIFVGALIYPVYACWMWGGGWLAQLGLLAGLGHGGVDYAGSSVVHMAGGAIALATCIQLGPRIGKYDEHGNPRPIFGHHMPMVILGTLVLGFGWFGFNAGSSLSGSTPRIALIAVNTMLASVAGALVACAYMWYRYGKPDPSMICSGMLAGLVAITASCAYVVPAAAFFIGAIAGLLASWGIIYLERKGIDDPVGAISVHGINGFWGLIAVGLFADGSYGMGTHGVRLIADGRELGVTGLFYGSGKQLVAQLICAVVCFAWSFGAAAVIFWAVGKFLGSNRVAPEVEIAGLDIPEMGAPGYPEFINPVAPENVMQSEIAAARATVKALGKTKRW